MACVLKVENLSAGYHHPIVSDVHFQVQAGELVGILGRNGLGKTTLLRGITGDARRFSGTVRVAGKDCSGLSVKKLARLLTVLPQKTQIPPGITARDVLEMGCYAGNRLWGGISADNQKQITFWAKKLGIENLLESDCSRLSAGQQQMVMLCRLLVQNTPVMLLDEPNTALDYSNTHRLFQILRSVVLEQKKAVLAVLHDPEAALRWCDRLLLMDGGKIVKTLQPSTSDEETLTESLQILFPGIRVRKNPHTGGYFCYIEEVNL